MIGAIIGDIAGSRFVFDNYRGTDFEIFHRESFFTDDTVCTIAIDVIRTLINFYSLLSKQNIYPEISGLIEKLYSTEN